MDEAATNGVRSGITSLGSEDVQSHPTGGEVTPRVVRMSLRPPARFTEKADFALWIRRFERYVLEAKIPDEKRTSELFPLLEDEPFRVVVQQGLVDSTDYDEVVQCLRRQYDPEGNELEFHCRFQQRVQSSGEKLTEFVGALRFLADKAYPQWSGGQRLEVVRRQFIQGLRSSSMQMKLMRENPESLDEAVRLACQWETIEAAQRTFQKERATVAEALEPSERDRSTAAAAHKVSVSSGRRAEDIAKQLEESEMEIRRLSELTERLRRKLGETQPFRGQERRRIVCWACGQAGHTKRFCPRRKKQSSPAGTAAVSSSLIVNGCISGRKTRMLVDTGSGVTLIGEKVWRELGSSPNGSAPLEEPTRAVVVANGETLDVLGQVELDVVLGGLVKKHMVLVARQLTHDCLLGADFLCQHNCIIDLHNRVLLAGDQSVTMCASECNNGSQVQLCFVSMSETIVIPASCRMRLPVTVHSGNTTMSSDVIMEPLMKFNDQHSLLVAHSLMKANSDHMMVEILNLNPAPVTVHKDEKVGVLKPVAEVCEWREARKNAVNHPSTLKNRDMTWAEKMLAGAHDLSAAQKDAAMHLLMEFENIFAKNDDDFGRTSLVYHGIDTEGASPIRQQPRRLPYHRRDEVRKLLDSMLTRGVIEPSSSPWAAPIVLAKKRDGSTRFCVDFRRLNDVTRKDAQPLPRIDDTLDALGRACYFSTLDLASGYWQVEVKPGDREKTAFVTPHGLFQFRVMPFGLCNAPATFQRLMEHVLAGLHWSTCLVYLDDIIVFSATVEEHLERLKEVCLRLKGAGLKMKPSKCHLFQSSVKYLGHVVCKEGIKTDPDKIQCIADWPVPNDVKKLKCFLGLASY